MMDFLGDGSDYSNVPSINGIQADFTSFNNIVSGDATSEDYGRGVGAAVGAYFGEPQLGADVGSHVFSFINDLIK